MTIDEVPPPQVWPTFGATDARALIRFLVDVVGFEETAVYGEGDVVVHAELAWPLGGGVMLGSERAGAATVTAPGRFSAYVVVDEPDALHERVRAAGVEVTQELHDTDHGSREFGIRDPEGNHWYFGTYRGAPRASSPGS
jgi:uncharacterized glyoxalase superfamily protein PhnB